MYRDYSKDPEKKWAYDWFIKEDFKATLVENNDNFLAFDWRRSDGGGNLSTRYILDKKRGTLIISGDSGDCIASWFNKVSAKDMECYINSIDYFMGKFQTSSNKYSYDYRDIKEDFELIREEIKENIFEYIKDKFNLTDEDCESFPSDIIEFWQEASEISDVDYPICHDYDEYDLDEYLDELEHWAYEKNGDYLPEMSRGLDRFVEEFYTACIYESDLADCGCRISKRVYLWAVGYQMGIAQLNFTNEITD